MSQHPGSVLNSMINAASAQWGARDMREGHPSLAHKALSQILSVAAEDSLRYVTIEFDAELETKFRLHVFTQDLLLSVVSDGVAMNTVLTKITPRAHLMGLRVISAPVITDSGEGPSIPLTLELDYPDQALTLTNRGGSDPTVRAKLPTFMESLIKDLCAHAS
jgi:hypothetical protein